MKKVFSVEKFKESMKSFGYVKTIIDCYLANWANECEGLTEEEMNKLGYRTGDNWMIEVEESK